jgi:hypothetical protein
MLNGRELWISQICFPMENPVDRVHGAWIGQRGRVHRGSRWHEQKGVAAPCRRAGARACRCSPWVVEEDEPDKAVPQTPHRSMSGGGGAA